MWRAVRTCLGFALLLAVALPAPSIAQDEPAFWQPPAGVTFQIQLQGTIDTSVEAEVYDIDMFDSPVSLVDELHAQGRHVVCYMSAGTYEKWRPDAGDFPKRVLGKRLEDWPGERWLDVRKIGVLSKIMDARLDMCKAKGFDAVDFDNIDVWTQKSGFPITRKESLAYIAYLSEAAHARGLAAGLKNLPQLAERLQPDWDFVVNEQCFLYDECDGYLAFIEANKPVFNIEYELELSEFCDEGNAMGFTSMKKRFSLKAWRRPCWEG